jgi:large subunit ribosomal protein L21
MEAIIRDGSRQFRVQEGLTIDVDYRDAEPGTDLEFGEVLYLSGEGGLVHFGQPVVEGAKVVGKVLGTVKGPKLVVTQFRRRKDSRTRTGHRELYTQVHIEKIHTPTTDSEN